MIHSGIFFFNSVSFTFGYTGSLLLHRGFSVVMASWGSSLVALCGLLVAVASLVAEHGFLSTQVSVVVAQGSRVCAFSSCGTWA